MLRKMCLGRPGAPHCTHTHIIAAQFPRHRTISQSLGKMFLKTLQKLKASKTSSSRNKNKQSAGEGDLSQSAPKPLVDPFLDRIFLEKPNEMEFHAKKSCCFSTKSSFERSEGHRLSEADSLRLQEILRKNHALNGNAFGDKESSGQERPAGEIITEQKLEQEKIGLHETETIKLLEIQSTATPKDLLLPDANIESAAIVAVSGEEVEKKSKKMVDAKTQTMNLQVKQKSTMTTPLLSREVECEATIWDLYDATMKQGDTSRKEELNPKFISLPWREMGRREAEKQQKAPQLGKSAMVIERFLASNLYKNQQAMYFGQPAKIDDKKRSTRFQYELCPLWTHQSNATKNKSVLNLAWNTTNSNILAVAYGQFLLSEDKQGGIVCCWSTKNPTQPERSYPFEHSVTALVFSLNSQLLVAGLQDGKIIVLDVSHAEKKAFVEASLKDGGHVGPVWVLKSVQWTHGEAIVSAGEDGQLLIWSLNLCRIGRFLARIPIGLLKTEKVAGASDVMDEVPIQEVFSILDFSISNGTEPLIYVATKEGYILEVEMELQIQRVVRAHLGPIYKVQVSPFCWQLALTAGADGKVLLWARSKKDAPILSLAVSASAVVSAEWSPSFSTIVACASGTILSVWDLARKTHEPVTKVNVGALLTSLIFSSDGMNILVGDRSGKIHVYSLQDMPYKPLMQVEALIKAIPGLNLL